MLPNEDRTEDALLHRRLTLNHDGKIPADIDAVLAHWETVRQGTSFDQMRAGDALALALLRLLARE